MTELDNAVSVAQAAGRLLLEIRHDAGAIPADDKTALKALRDRADRASHDLIVAQLEVAEGYGLVSEEGVDDDARLSSVRVWIVDPLDGTWEYGQGRSDFGVHIALWDVAGQQMSLGVVDLPAQGLTRTSADHGARPAALPTDRPYRVVASRTRPPAGLDAIIERFAARIGHEVEVVNVGSVGAKVNEILSGRAEAYLHDTGFYEWDLAAPLAVAHHYGLVCDHWDGSSVRFNAMPPFVANVFVAHPHLADDLRASLAEG